MGVPFKDPLFSIALITLKPSIIWPKTTFLLSRYLAVIKEMINYEVLRCVVGSLYIDNKYGTVCFSLKFSSANGLPYIDSPPCPLLYTMSPPIAITFVVILKNSEFVYVKGLPVVLLIPEAPLHKS